MIPRLLAILSRPCLLVAAHDLARLMLAIARRREQA